MSGNVDFITAGEKLVQEALLSGAFFKGIDVFTNANGDLAATVEEKLAGLKRSVVLRIAQGVPPQPGTSEPWDLYVVVSENPILNRAEPFDGKTARWIVQKIMSRANAVGINFTKVTEILGGDAIVWQLVGTVEVAMPPGDADPQPI